MIDPQTQTQTDAEAEPTPWQRVKPYLSLSHWTVVRIVRTLWFLMVTAVIVGLPFAIIELYEERKQNHYVGWFVAAVFVMLAVPISVWSIFRHVYHYNQPQLQKHVIRVLWMVPIYSINAWFALRFKESAIYLNTLRECYEAFVIYSFAMYLQNYLGTQEQVVEILRSKDAARGHHIFPLGWMEPWEMGEEFFTLCRIGVSQYVLIRPVFTIIALILETVGCYHEGSLSPSYGFLYVAGVNNFSQIWAMYCLLMFYRAVKEELAPIKPVGKFLCVKSVVFFSFWQAILIAALVQFDVIHQENDWRDYTVEDVANGIQDFLICIEMFIAAIAHIYIFGHKEYQSDEPGEQDATMWTNLCEMFDMSDVKHEVKHVVHHTHKKIKVIQFRKGKETNKTPLLSAEDREEEDADIEVETSPPPPPQHQ
eukprot:GFYU01004583.1.p1 GENE.GFYU01004583.1~~GFYU01004583.1.p1  ORF type:complete len:423 (-),score=116.55 GFYU01004583.1:130-1398(-)